MPFDITYTPEEEKAIKEIRERTKEVLIPRICNDPHYFYRFLKARNFKMDQAEYMLRKHMVWGNSIQLLTMFKDYDPPEVLKKYVSSSLLGFDKDGSIVRILHVGNNDFKGLMKSANKIDILKNTLKICLLDDLIIQKQCKKLGKIFLPTMLILDCANLTFGKVTDRAAMQIFITDVSTFQDNFPECLKKIFIINASVYFTMIYSFVKPILVGPIVEKLNIFGEDGWKEELLKLVNPEVLPVCLGGTRTDPDGNPLCQTIINYGGAVPESYYLKKDIEKFARQTGVKNISIARGATFEERLTVKHADSIIEWEFELRSGSIGVEIKMEDSKSKDLEPVRVLVPAHILFETEYEPIKGKLSCEYSGTYILVFSNKHSWMHSKEVYYRTSIKRLEEEVNKQNDELLQIAAAYL